MPPIRSQHDCTTLHALFNERLKRLQAEHIVQHELQQYPNAVNAETIRPRISCDLHLNQNRSAAFITLAFIFGRGAALPADCKLRYILSLVYFTGGVIAKGGRTGAPESLSEGAAKSHRLL